MGLPASAAERRLVTVLFVDLVGFTTFAEERDPEAVRELLSRYFTSTTEVIERHGGTVEKFIGDAVMAVWGTPVAHEDDAERAVRAALEVVDAVRALGPGLQARAAVVAGDAAVTLGAANQGMVAGDVVNTAARIQGVAEPGTVLVGEAAMHAASGAIVFEAIGDQTLKGKRVPVPVWRALRVVSKRGGQGRTESLEPPFVGREDELRLLKDQLHAVGRERRLRLVAIDGPGGIGKSRLVWELLKYVDGLTEPIYWHRGRSPSYGDGIAFWALGEMVRQRAGLTEDDDEARTREQVGQAVGTYIADPAERSRVEMALLSLLGVEPGPLGGREALFPAWRQFFERIAEQGTTVLVFEDLQWADAGLIDFIDHLRDWSRGLPILIVTLARPDLVERHPDWRTGRRLVTTLPLEPLPDEAVAELLAGLVPGLPPSAVAAIVQRADGIPLYAVETVRSLITDGRIHRQGDVYEPAGDLTNLAVPESLRSLIASRLDVLDPGMRQLLQQAAALGHVFPADVLASIAGLSIADTQTRLRELMRRELLDIETDPRSPERGQYRFVQSLIREVAYGTLGRRERRALHLAIARHFEGIGEDEIAAALASHYVQAHATSDAGEEADAVAGQARLALMAAARRAISLGAHDQAVAYLEQAEGMASDPLERAQLQERAAASAAAASRIDAVTLAERAVETYRSLGDDPGRLRASARLGRVLIDLGELRPAIEILEATLPAVEEAGDRPLLAEVLANLSRAYMRTNENERSIALADRALPIAEQEDLAGIVADLLNNKGSALGNVGRRRESTALLRAAVEVAREIGQVGLELRASINLSETLRFDDVAAAGRTMEETLRRAREVGDRVNFSAMLVSALEFRLSAGVRWDEALADHREALEASTVPFFRARLTASGRLIEAARGLDLDHLLPQADAEIGDHDDPDVRFQRQLLAAEVALVSGRPETSIREALQGASLPVYVPEFALVAAARAAVWARDLETLQLVRARLDASPQGGAWISAVRLAVRAATLALEGDSTEAVAAYRSARTELERQGLTFARARQDLEALILLPDDPEVRGWAGEARIVFEALGARPYLDRLDAAPGSSAVEPPADARGAPGALGPAATTGA